MIQQTSTSILFPYTTLFRSKSIELSMAFCSSGSAVVYRLLLNTITFPGTNWPSTLLVGLITIWYRAIRSEEHTSELQSRENVVCRLLLEKKNYRLHVH